MKEDVAIVIPAYNPNEELKKLVNKLKTNAYKNIIVVNDGSKVWEELNVTVIEHTQNEGKGQALKTGFSYCVKQFENIIGIIAADADGQHTIEDINKIYNELRRNQNSLILGTRNFKENDVPFKSRLGNKVMGMLINRENKYSIQDTQTGLRAIPIQYINQIIQIRGKRFEYEMHMLLYFMNHNIEVIQIPIQTVYKNKNRGSNFKPIIDSIKIASLYLHLRTNKVE